MAHTKKTRTTGRREEGRRTTATRTTETLTFWPYSTPPKACPWSTQPVTLADMVLGLSSLMEQWPPVYYLATVSPMEHKDDGLSAPLAFSFPFSSRHSTQTSDPLNNTIEDGGGSACREDSCGRSGREILGGRVGCREPRTTGETIR